MNNLPDNVSKILDQLSQRFGATGAHLWSVYVKYTFTNGLVWTIAGVVMTAIGFVIAKYGCKYWINSDNDDSSLIGALIATIGAIVLLAGFLVFFNWLAMAIYPEGAALANVL